MPGSSTPDWSVNRTTMSAVDTARSRGILGRSDLPAASAEVKAEGPSHHLCVCQQQRNAAPESSEQPSGKGVELPAELGEHICHQRCDYCPRLLLHIERLRYGRFGCGDLRIARPAN